jgi:5-methyltetrahydropteroyltriglutamate--homocysteine methyltransferase
MKRSTQRILTTHTGSLPRPGDLTELMLAREAATPADPAALDARIAEATRETVQRQIDAGLDVVNDGEMSKPSYSTYVKDRLNGFEGESGMPMGGALRDEKLFPGFRIQNAFNRGHIRFPACNGPISLKDPGAVRRDIANLQAATVGTQVEEVFVTAVSPGQVARFMGNTYYPSHEAYVFALAEAMKYEYKAIVEAGFVLQLDCPDLASGRSNSTFADLTLEEWKKQVAFMHIDALNAAIAGLPEDRLRLHLCWGNYEGPHVGDVPLRDILDVAFGAQVQAISFEGANPRHAHEWKVFETVKLPAGKIIIPGVLDSCTNYVEHPELVSQRIVRYASLVGRENVIAGVDCGFGTFVGDARVHGEVAWAKLASMAEGARLATAALWR